MPNSRHSLRAALLASAGSLAFAGNALAQEDETPDVDVLETDEDYYTDEIVITGIRRSIEDSLDLKKSNSSIVEAISAEDIGRLPDISIADALARLPGVTSQRVRGRSQGISIRGLGPNLSVGLLNGREQVSANNNRGIEFDQYPSELIGGALVYKTPDASLAAFGIAGAVDNRTRRPLDFSERKVNVSARYVVNDRDQLNPDYGTDGYRYFGSYIDQNSAGTIGWSIGATVQSNPTQFVSRELKTGQNQTAIDPATGLVYPADNPRFGNVSRDFQRTSVAGALQFEPTDRFRTVIDAYYTDTQDEGIFRGVETPIASWSGAEFESATGDGPFADAARYNNVVPILRTDTEGNSAEIFSAGINVAFDVTDRLTLTGDFAHSTLDRDDVDYESYAGTGPSRSGAQDTFGFGFSEDGDFAVETLIDYTDPSNVLLTDPGGWGQVGFLREPEINDELNQLRLDADYEVDLGPIASVKVGYLRTEREKDFDNAGTFLRAGDRFTDVIEGEGVGFAAPIPAGTIEGATDPADLGLSIIAYDPASLLTDGTYLLEPAIDDIEWVVEEDIDTFYAMAELETVLGTVPVTGNIGVQYVNTTQSSTGTLTGAGLQTVEESYGDWLPSLNLTFEVVEDTLLRFATYRSITRARLDDLAANQNIGFDPTSCVDTDTDQVPDQLVDFNPPERVCFSLGGGNPTLQPYESVGYDVSFEHYMSPTSAIIFALFRKDLSDWVFNERTFVDGTAQIDAFGAGDFLDANPELSLTALDGPVNIAEGKIQGFEITGRLGFGDFAPALEGFGLNASYTYIDSELDFGTTEIAIPGYSDKIWSAEVYYEKDGIRARVNARHRSDFLAEVQRFDAALIQVQTEAETILDAQLGYVFESGPLDGLSIIGEVFNLTNEPFTTVANTIGGDPFPNRYEEYGRTFNLTVAKGF